MFQPHFLLLLSISFTIFVNVASTTENLFHNIIPTHLQSIESNKQKVNSLLQKEYETSLENSKSSTISPNLLKFSSQSRHYKLWLKELIKKNSHYSLYNSLSLHERFYQKVYTNAVNNNKSLDSNLISPSISISSSSLYNTLISPSFSTSLYSNGVLVNEKDKEYKYFWEPVDSLNYLSSSYHYYKMNWMNPSESSLTCPRSLSSNSTHLAFELSLTRCPNPDYNIRMISSNNISWKPNKNEKKSPSTTNTTNSVTNTSSNSLPPGESEETSNKDTINPYLIFALVLPPEEHPFSRRILQMLRSIAPMYPSILFVNGMASEFSVLRKKYHINSLPKILFFKNGIFTGKASDLSDVSSLSSEISLWSEMMPQSLPLLPPFPHQYLLQDNRVLDQNNIQEYLQKKVTEKKILKRLKLIEKKNSKNELNIQEEGENNELDEEILDNFTTQNNLPIFINHLKYPILNNQHPKGKHYLILSLSFYSLFETISTYSLSIFDYLLSFLSTSDSFSSLLASSSLFSSLSSTSTSSSSISSLIKFFPYKFDVYFLPVLTNKTSYERFFVSFRISQYVINNNQNTNQTLIIEEENELQKINKKLMNKLNRETSLIFHYEFDHLLLLPYPNLEPFISSGSYYYYIDRVAFLLSTLFFILFIINLLFKKKN